MSRSFSRPRRACMSMSMCPSLLTFEIYVDRPDDHACERHSPFAVKHCIVSVNIREPALDYRAVCEVEAYKSSAGAKEVPAFGERPRDARCGHLEGVWVFRDIRLI